MSTTPDKKDWHMYTSRKSVKPQNSNWPAVFFETQVLLFCSFKTTVKCKDAHLTFAIITNDMQRQVPNLHN